MRQARSEEVDMEPAVRCWGLVKRYGKVTALDGLDLVVEPGQVFGFLGPNGAGKTTTLRILLGLVRPTRGRAWLNGRPVPDPAGLARVGAMIEEPAFHPWLSGRRNLELLALAGPPLPEPRSIDRVLERTGLAGAAGRTVKGYSQGMRQRLGLAAALMRRPALLLLDEPANGMDPAGIREFRTLLRSLADDGTTVFLSSHLLAEVEQVCDEIAVLRAGRLVRQGRVADLASAWSRVRVTVPPGRHAAALAVLARWQVSAERPGSLLVSGAEPAPVNETLARSGIFASEVGIDRASLEDVFLRLTGAMTTAGKTTSDLTETCDAPAAS
jgi:ABC-2 type transport system ATP-binding protein